MDDKLWSEIAACDSAKRIRLILEKCFSMSVDEDVLQSVCDFPIVEIEDNLFVLELERAGMFVSIDTIKRPFVIAAVLTSAYMDLDTSEKANLFLPNDKDLVCGAVLARDLGVPIDIFVGADEDKEEKACFIGIDKKAVGEIIKDFSDFDDYVFDPISALAAGAFACVEEDVEDMPSVIVSVASPMQYAKEVISALGVKARDEQEAKRKLEELFAVDLTE